MLMVTTCFTTYIPVPRVKRLYHPLINVAAHVNEHRASTKEVIRNEQQTTSSAYKHFQNHFNQCATTHISGLSCPVSLCIICIHPSLYSGGQLHILFITRLLAQTQTTNQQSEYQNIGTGH